MGQLTPIVAKRVEGRDVYVSRREESDSWSVVRSADVRGESSEELDGSPVGTLAEADALIDQDVTRRAALVELWGVSPAKGRWVTVVTVLEPTDAIRLGSSLLGRNLGRNSFSGSGSIVGTGGTFEEARALVPAGAVEITPPDYGGEGVQLLATVGVAPGRR